MRGGRDRFPNQEDLHKTGHYGPGLTRQGRIHAEETNRSRSKTNGNARMDSCSSPADGVRNLHCGQRLCRKGGCLGLCRLPLTLRRQFGIAVKMLDFICASESCIAARYGSGQVSRQRTVPPKGRRTPAAKSNAGASRTPALDIRVAPVAGQYGLVSSAAATAAAAFGDMTCATRGQCVSGPAVDPSRTVRGLRVLTERI